MENQPTTLDKAVKISIIAGALIVALSIAYYLVIFLPKKQELDTRQGCADEAKTKAKNLIQKKTDITKNQTRKETNEDLIAKGMFLKVDYDDYYEDCLSRKGLKK